MEIPFSAFPEPEVTWSFNGGPLPVDARRIKQETIIGMTSLVLAKIKMAEAGRYRVTMKNQSGHAEFAFNVKVLGKPGPVESLHVTRITESTVALAWEPVSNDGGSKVLQYVVEKREQGKRSWSQVDMVDGLQCTARNLAVRCAEDILNECTRTCIILLFFVCLHVQVGIELLFRVAAENEVGVGEFVELSKAVSPQSEHGKMSFIHMLI